MKTENCFIDDSLVVKKTPYPHLVIDNFLPDDLLKPIISNWKILDKYYHHFSNGGKRKSIQFGTKKYYDLIENNNEFKKVHEYVSASNFFKEIYNKLQPYLVEYGLRKQFRNFGELSFMESKTDYLITDNLFKKAIIKFFVNPIIRKFRIRSIIRRIFFRLTKPACHPLVSFSTSTEGYLEPPHADARHKIFVGLIYLDDMEDEGGLNIYKDKFNSFNITSCPMFPNYDKLDIEKRLQPKRNRLVLFLNSNNAWHGTVPFNSDSRRFIYFAFAARWVESAFETDYEVLAGDS